MIRMIALRLFWAVPTLLAVITVTFFLMRAAPGGPFDTEQQMSPVIEAQMRVRYGLDQPLGTQYTRFLGGVLQGDFGPSYKYKDMSVRELILDGLPVSATIGSLAMLLALLLGIPLGMVAGLNHNKRLDTLVMGISMLGITVPPFVMAPLLALFFGIMLHWLPVGGWNDGALPNLVLPVLALALPQLAAIARLTRGSLLDVLRQNYIRTARAKGLPWRTILSRHALKPTLMPVISYLGPAAAGLLTGSVVIEVVFGLPGIGRYFVNASLNRDYTLVLGVVIVYAALLILFNLLVDIAYGWLDPRVRARGGR
jgi:oligopeptide transport system permease protein